MGYSGAGTQDSPIAIDDSEDEVVQELEETSFSPDGDVQYLGRIFNQTHEDPPVQEKKRKRASSFIEQPVSVAGPSHVPPLGNRLSQPESKKARKRRRKLERQAAEEARLRGLGWLNNPIPFAPGLSQSFPASWPTQFPMQSVYIPSYPAMTNHTYPSMNASDFYNFVGEEDAGYYNYPLPSPPPEASGSKWVSSMAMAVDPVDEAAEEAPLPPLPPPSPPPPLPPPLVRPPSPRPPSYMADAPITNPKEHHPPPPKPAQPQLMPIGMVPDPDPKSKRGTFIISDTMKEAGTDRQKRRRNYMPNPARTLVMENLPKTHRTSDFVNNWSRKTCGALPVHLFIDTSGAKALIEFSTAELARKVWNSPRLGSNMAGVKNFIKGQPREDLIRVWWYRVDGIGAGAGVGEIEEGEIEDDAADAPKEEGEDQLPPPLPLPLPQPYTETKREKKARLAKEREEKKQQKEQKLRLLQQERQAFEQKLAASHEGLYNGPPAYQLPSSGFNPAATQGDTLNGYAPPAAPSLPPAVAPLPAPTSTLPLPPHRPLVSGSSQPAVLSEHGVQRTAFGASLLLGVRCGHDDNDSIASSTGRRSPSPPTGPSMPVPASKFFIASTSGQGDDLDNYEEVDMDVEVDDASHDASLPSPTPSLLPPIPPLVHSLPPRPTPLIRAAKQRSAVQKPPLALRQLPEPAPNSLTARLPSQQPPHKSLPHRPTVARNKSVQPPAAQRPVHVSSVAATPSASTTAPLSAPSPGASSPSIPSEPKAMKNAPTQPSFTKRALLARQKELEERISKSKMELAAATASKAAVMIPITPRPQSPASVFQQQQFTKPAMDLGDKQAMEDRLRKLVLQSQKARGKVTATPPSTASSTAVSSAPSPSPIPVTPSPVDEMLHNNAAQCDSTVTMSSFSLEDMAISFITQTIETIKAQPPSVPSALTPPPPALPPALPPTSSPTSTPTTQNTESTASSAPVESAPSVVAKIALPSNNVNDERLELAAKQKRLEMHISESKALMAKLSQARNKEEKDSILKVMREKSRLYEEENRNVDAHHQPPSRPSPTVPAGVAAKATTTTVTSAIIGKAQSTSFQFSHLWPGNQHDAGVLILSDDSDNDDDMEDDED